jgi:methionyl-tRNA formyltransferase
LLKERKNLRIVFMGTPEFAVPCLDMLIKEGYDIAAVVTQPDKPKGRGKKLAFPPIKEKALQHNIDILQPAKIKTPEFTDELRSLKPDLLVTAAYGQLLSKEILDIAPLGCINVHASLLPKYRGAAPIHWAIINGETVTGITTMYTDIGMDTGDMLLKRQIEIPDDMTAGELHDRLSVLGAQVLKETLQGLKDGSLQRAAQSESEATYAPIIQKEIGKIDWSESSKTIHNLVRGTNPWPGAYTFYQGERMRVWKTEIEDDVFADTRPGTIRKVNKEGIIVSCGKGLVKIKEIQFDSCRKMSVEEYICGHKIIEGELLG